LDGWFRLTQILRIDVIVVCMYFLYNIDYLLF
jgi:hypothetical protein